MKRKMNDYDPVKHLKNEKVITEFINAFIEEAPELLPEALSIVAKAKGITELSKETGLTRQTLYAALGDNGNPTFSTINKILNSFNIKLKATLKTI
ncbi:MAG: putative addiction module antidote protein [Bifidobacteriaceae bacterium]|jgi:probable addiction module antidote protein|nr:putative addiction module antidote protein [Bifidobacteriaceae bacterium]